VFLLEWLFAFLERFQERHFEPQQRIPKEAADAWLLYRMERVERRLRWIFILLVVVPIVQAILLLAWRIAIANGW